MEKLENKFDQAELKSMLSNHYKYTGSLKAKQILDNFDGENVNFKKVIPSDFKRLLAVTAMYEETGMSHEDAQIEAFYDCTQSGEGERK